MILSHVDFVLYEYRPADIEFQPLPTRPLSRWFMTYLTDLQHRRIDAHISPEYVTEIHIINNSATGQRRAKSSQVWKIGPVIGRGGHGEVRIETCLADNRARAVKRIPMDPQKAEDAKELRALLEFSKPKYRDAAVFVDFFGWFPDSQNLSVFIAMEYLPLGDLETYARKHGPLPETDIRAVVKQVLEGLQIMHRESFAHQDLKPQNILICQASPNWWIKLADFGLSKRLDESVTTQVAGSFGYMAPEIFGFTCKGAKTAVDFWALGCIIYRLATGIVPFQLTELPDYCSNGVFPSFTANISNSLLELIKNLLSPNPLLRPCAQKALQSRWITTDDADEKAPESKHEQSPMPFTTTSNGYNTETHPGLKTIVLPRNPSKERMDEQAQPGSLGTFTRTESPSWRNNASFQALGSDERRALPSFSDKTLPPTPQESFSEELSHLKELVQPPSRNKLVVDEAENQQGNGGRRSNSPQEARRQSSQKISPTSTRSDSPATSSLQSQTTSPTLTGISFRLQQKLPAGFWGRICVDFSPDGQYLAVGSEKSQPTIWETSTGSIWKTLTPPFNHVGKSMLSVAFSPDGQLLATSMNDTAVSWEVETGLVCRIFAGHSQTVSCVAFSPDGKLVATASMDSTAKLWDTETGTLHLTLSIPGEHVSKVTFSPDGRSVATLSSDRTARIWDTTTGNLCKAVKRHTDGGHDVAFSPDGKMIATTSRTGIVLWKVGSWSYIKTLGHRDILNWVESIAFSPDSRVIAAGNFMSSGPPQLFDIESGSRGILCGSFGSCPKVFHLTFSPDGRRIATAGDGAVKLWVPNDERPKSWWHKVVNKVG
ncbi:kinase-like domain-containing protein [Thelonectria olida]|uniref:Kinase-like domain-containing protein n=1 Tax=Thelonectria olida TaxID=1576542 RepID=A0A9P8W1T7_9HYPO|nr:kinase-like domain-containing protein [Thelonectria olida]